MYEDLVRDLRYCSTHPGIDACRSCPRNDQGNLNGGVLHDCADQMKLDAANALEKMVGLNDITRQCFLVMVESMKMRDPKLTEDMFEKIKRMFDKIEEAATTADKATKEE